MSEGSLAVACVHPQRADSSLTVEERAALGPGTTRPAGSIVKRRSRGGGATTGPTLRALAGLSTPPGMRAERRPAASRH
jgi:hypothetical protein